MKSPFVSLGLALALVLSLGVGYGVLYHWTQNENATRLSLEETLRTRAGGTGVASAVRAGIAGQEALVQQYFVVEEGAPQFIDDIEARGRAHGARAVISSVAKSGAGEAATLVLALTIKGPFAAVVKTVGALEYAPYHLIVPSVVLVRDAKDEWRADLKLVVAVPPPLTTL